MVLRNYLNNKTALGNGILLKAAKTLKHQGPQNIYNQFDTFVIALCPGALVAKI